MDNVLLFDNEPLFEDEGLDNGLNESIVHIRILQRKSRKYITTVQGLKTDLSLTKIAKYMRKTFHCQADVFDVEENGVKEKIIKLQGDQRDNIKKFFIEEKIVPEKLIKVHGF